MRQEPFERGSGMTRKRYVRIDFDNFAEYVEYLEGEPTYEGELRNLIEFCQRRLRANGFPDTLFVRLGKNRREAIYDHIIERLGHDEDTDAGYAARILWHAHFALDPSTQKRIWDFAYHIGRACSLNTEAALKFDKWGKFAEQQLKHFEVGRSKSANSRKQKRDEIAADFVREAKDIRQRKPDLKCHSVAVQIHNRRKGENLRRSEDDQLPNQTDRRISDKIRHLWN